MSDDSRSEQGPGNSAHEPSIRTAQQLAAYLDDYLGTAVIRDWSNALNGLQVDSQGPISKVAAAVDASEASIRGAVAAGSQMLLVHHGLFWDGNQPVTGRRYRRVRALIENDVALYSSHLPLDVHEEVGNNAVLARELGVVADGSLGEREGVPMGVTGALEMRREDLRDRLAGLLGHEPQLIPGGPEQISRVAVVTGAAGSMVAEARAAGVDALITGEGAHHTYFDAMEGGVNLYYGGHYATETWGVRALAQHLEQRFGLEWLFLDLPTGL